MTTVPEDNGHGLHATDEVHDERRAAVGYLTEAFAQAQHDGLDGDALAQAALFMAFQALVEAYGEEATAEFAEGFPKKILAGNFTVATRH
jgi:hypothetical protein